LDEVLLKARSKNKKIIKIDVDTPKSLKKDKIFQIFGIDNDGKKYVLHTFIPEQKQGNIKQQIINDFLEN
jgi:hypothetical protein